ncbi:MAG: hypothetical protein HFI05_02135 [Lachnospiraceae bacterium]|jgi:hypothetical protein|nr:hypothetical protein [Lachnospiraceae bacterium]
MDNLFSAEWTVGDLSTIGFIKKWLGVVAVLFISIIGFGIVIATIIRNAINGLYAVNPKFWDRVDDVKRSAFNTKNEGGNNISKTTGTIIQFVLNLCPNIKMLTDFQDGNNLDAKAYFMRAIPMAVIQIFIGVFIFYGYPSKVADKFAEFGTGVLDVVLYNVDPTAWVNKIPTEFVSVKLSTDGAKDDISKAINKIAKQAWNAYVGELSDMTKEKRLEIGKSIENWVISNTEPDLSSYCNTDRYELSVTATIYNQEPDIERYHGVEVDGIYTFAYYTPLDTWSHGSTKNTTNKYLYYYLEFKPKASKGDTTSVECKMTTRGGTAWEASEHSITITADSEGNSISSFNGLNEITGYAMMNDGAKVKIRITKTNNTLTITPTPLSANIKDAQSIVSISGLYYQMASNKHKITEIVKGAGNETSFTPINSDGGILNWNWGEAPSKSTDSKSNTKETESTKSNLEGGW